MENNKDIKEKLTNNLNNIYIEEEKEKLWLCIKELQDMAWDYLKENRFDIFKKIWCLDEDINLILNKIKVEIKDTLKILKINKSVLGFLATILIGGKDLKESESVTSIEVELGGRFIDYKINRPKELKC